MKQEELVQRVVEELKAGRWRPNPRAAPWLCVIEVQELPPPPGLLFYRDEAEPVKLPED